MHAVGEKVKQLQAVLHKQISGKGVQAEEKDEQEWQQLLLEAMAVKARSLVVLDDPWMPEQVRFLNPIDSSQSKEHRLLITTRIRDLVPTATRVERASVASRGTAARTAATRRSPSTAARCGRTARAPA